MGHGQRYISRTLYCKSDKTQDDMDAFLERYERFAESQGWEKEDWAVCLSPLLTGKGLQVYASMPAATVTDYDQLKEALLKRYELTSEGFRKKFREGKPDVGETSSLYHACPGTSPDG